MSSQTCIACRATKAERSCGVCSESVCNGCAQFLKDETFSFRNDLAPEIKHHYYCPNCYDTHITPALEEYEEQMNQAKGVFVFFTTGKRAVPTLKKSLTWIEIKDCLDRDETIMRLAFNAVRMGYNAIINTEVKSVKSRNKAYQKSIWSGEALPVLVDADRMQREYDRAQGKRFD